jgi:hypothetical protein
MRELSKEDFKIVEEFMEPYRDILEDVLTSSDIESEAQKQAWEDWAIEKLMDELLLTEDLAKLWINKLEQFYRKEKYD